MRYVLPLEVPSLDECRQIVASGGSCEPPLQLVLQDAADLSWRHEHRIVDLAEWLEEITDEVIVYIARVSRWPANVILRYGAGTGALQSIELRFYDL